MLPRGAESQLLKSIRVYHAVAGMRWNYRTFFKGACNELRHRFWSLVTTADIP